MNPVLPLAGVTKRELEIFWLVADRLHNKEIADRLYVSVRTVESHVSALLRKIGGTDRQSLVDAAIRLRDNRPSPALPRPLSSFVGRAREVDDLRGLVTAHRMLTLTGPAGAGKTRLALQIARSAAGLPPAVLVDLAVVAPGEAPERAFADALGIVGEQRRLPAALRETLAGGEHWLVVDNCEHVAAGVADLLAELLAGTPRLTVLATSHGPLRVDGEVVYEIGPLDLPDAERLFADRAGAAAPGFTVTAENSGAVATICRRLDGLPLAVELAAARVRVFSPAELVTHLDNRFALLTDGPPGRHRTLEAALRWSYQLLDEDERLLFERCSVFPGDFDYDTAADILAFPPVGSSDLTRNFPRLLDRSLISARRREQRTEYRMLDSVRQFARSRLTLRGEEPAMLERHARRHIRHAVDLLADLRGRDQAGALAWFDRHWADLRAAMSWALDHEETALAWEFLAGVGTGWEILGARGELFDWLDRLPVATAPEGRLGVHAAVAAAMLFQYQDLARGKSMAEHAIELATGAEDRALARLALGWCLLHDTERAAAIAVFGEVVETFVRLGDDWHHALALSGLGCAEPEPGAALGHLGRAADLFGRMGDHVKRANCLNHMGHRAVEAGIRLDEADGWLAEAARLAEQVDNQHELLHAEVFRATLEAARGEHAAAGARFDGVLAGLRRIGDQRCTCRSLLGLGRAAAVHGEHGAAVRYLREAATIADSLGEAALTATALRLLAESYCATDQFETAAVLLGAAEERHQDRAADRELHTRLRDRLGPYAFTAARSRGRDAPLARLLTD